MRVIIDIRPTLEPAGGVGIFTRCVAETLAMRGANEYAAFGNAFSGREPLFSPRLPLRFTRFPNKMLNAAFITTRRPTIETLAGPADAILFPNFTFFATRLPYAMTVHDLSFVRFQRFFTAKQRLWHAAVRPGRALRGAGAIIAVSEHTKQDVMEVFGTPAEKIVVAHPGVDERYFAAHDAETIRRYRKDRGLPERFILSLCTIEPRKNIEGLIEAHAAMCSDTDLVIAGGRGWLHDRIFRAAGRSPKKNAIRFLGRVDENEKPLLYAAASTFAYPSFYEGFGLPPLEAMASGTPVVASATSSLGEVIGTGGLLVNPHDIAGMAAALDAVMEDEPLRSQFIMNGRERARKFTWDATAAGIERALALLK